jgi:transglutaminase-like putative cysteine protease
VTATMPPRQSTDDIPPGRPRPHTPSRRIVTQPQDWRVTILAPLAAGTATLCASTSLTGVVSGLSWLGYVAVAIALVACAGLALRSVNVPVPLVGLAQLVVLLLLVTGVFSSHGILGIFPGPAAFSDLNDVLVSAFDQIRTGLPPVDATPPILCLVTIAMGLVAVLVDTLTVAASAPAATGLVLLCVYAVPASLSDLMLPWWTFVLGAAAFAALLAVDGNHRHRRWRNREAPAITGSVTTASAPVAVVVLALVLGLVAGGTITAVGTVGRLPGSGSGQGTGSGGLGVNPFTSLRGMLDQGTTVDLFRVRGLGNDQRLLRAFTLDTYLPNQGWSLPPGPMPAGYPALQPLPPAPGDTGATESREINIQPLNWNDVWLPVYGSLRSLQGISPGWYYDPESGAVFSERKQHPPTYTESASLAEPTKQQLETVSAPQTAGVAPVYTQISGVDPRVVNLAKQVTANSSTTFDKATALWRFFTAENRFTYDTRTAPAADSDALADFLLYGRRGFCEQFASAMAVMLRVLGIPSRVAVGFTTGFADGDTRLITSQDAHAWVEVYFGDLGWVSFDPTPRSDGRGYVPPYLQSGNSTNDPSAQTRNDLPSVSTTHVAPTGAPTAPNGTTGPAGSTQASPAGLAPGWTGWGALAVVLAAIALTVGAFVVGRRAKGRSAVSRWLPLVAAGAWLVAVLLTAWLVHWALSLALLVIAGGTLAPAIIREIQRRRRLRAIVSREPGAANAAWAELLDECTDRGVSIPPTDTVRTVAQKVAHEHHLDETGRNDLRTVVGTVERSWYAPDGGAEDPSFVQAFEGLRESLRRNAPMSWRGRLFPRSVFRRR